MNNETTTSGYHAGFTLAAYDLWLEKTADNPGISHELECIRENEAEISSRFWRELEFGTGGLRGELGAGINRMNVYTVGKATQGLALYLNSKSDTPSACIAYDTRHMSEEFAKTAARVLCANGIKTYIFNSTRPTPMLSFAVRYLSADAGIVITASHNPKQYNGYKVYGPDGGQITDEAASAILEKISAVDIFSDVKSVQLNNTGLISVIDENVDRAYYFNAKSLIMRKELLAEKAGELKILYSPLHGSGNIPVRRVLRELGFSHVDVVPEQEMPDGDFPTAPYPNPEESSVFKLAEEMARETDPALIFATDPDCDRIGVLCKTPSGEFVVLTGNQVGALLCDYILKTKRDLGLLPEKAAVIKTIVTTELAREICGEYGVTLIDVLTGFKYIGEKIGEWEQSGAYDFAFGFEESYGYLAGDFVRDKDAVIASALIAEMALYYKKDGITIYEAMQDLYKKYGYYTEKLISVSMPGQEGQARIAQIIADLRENYIREFAGENLTVFEDYMASTRVVMDTGEKLPIDLPKSNVLKFIFGDGSWLVLRPSGTEPKMKVYLGAKGQSAVQAGRRLACLEGLVEKWMK